MSRYTPPSKRVRPEAPIKRRSRSVQFGVWFLLVAMVLTVFATLLAALV